MELFMDQELDINHTYDKIPNMNDFYMHIHPFHEFYYFISGAGSFYLEGKEYPLTHGCILLMRSGEAHCLHISPEQSYERLVIHFDMSLIKTIDPTGVFEKTFFQREQGVTNFYTPDIIKHHRIHDTIQTMLVLNDELNDLNDTNFKKIHYTNLLISIFCELKKISLPPILIQKETNNLIPEVIHYINENLLTPLSLNSIADLFYVEKSYLNKQFRNKTGSTLWDYVIAKRLLKARELIEQGFYATEVSTICGWNDYSSFYRQYKTKIGCSPSKNKSN